MTVLSAAALDHRYICMRGEEPSDLTRIRELPLVGITASNLTGWSAKELRRASRDGVRVRGVRPGGKLG